MRRLMDDALEDLRYSLGSLLVSPISVDVAPIQLAVRAGGGDGRPDDRGDFAIRVGDVTSDATVAIPAEVLLPQLGEANPTSTTVNARELVQGQLANVPVDVSLRLAPAMVKPSVILNLAVGDVLPLPHPQSRPLDVAVGGHRLGCAAVGANGTATGLRRREHTEESK